MEPAERFVYDAVPVLVQSETTLRSWALDATNGLGETPSDNAPHVSHSLQNLQRQDSGEHTEQHRIATEVEHEISQGIKGSSCAVTAFAACFSYP
jgi:hypothetical protein